MDERFVSELIEDMEHMGRLLERCVRRLRSRMSVGAVPAMTNQAVEVPRVAVTHDDIRAEIDRQRKAIMAQVDEIKAQAIRAAATAKSGAQGVGLGVSGSLGNLGALGGMSTLGGMGGGMSSEIMDELRRKLTEKTEKSEKPEKDET